MTAFRPNDDVLFLMRIPKTGSTSLALMLGSHFPAEARAKLLGRSLDGWDHGLARIHDQFRRWMVRSSRGFAARAGAVIGRPDPVATARFLEGHHPIWAPIRTRKRVRAVTVLRDPVDRFLSNLAFIRNRARTRALPRSQVKTGALALEPDAFVRGLLASSARTRLNSHCLYLTPTARFEEAARALDEHLIMAALYEDLPLLNETVASWLGEPPAAMRREKTGMREAEDLTLSPQTTADLRAALAEDYRLLDHIDRNRSTYLQPRG
ncbi:MAG: hypothetical protein AAF565_13665 [Pseudomonadota bacterium]